MPMSPDASRHRILVVDDDPLMLELITTRLLLAGYQTALARDGQQGLTRLREFWATAMILDINMPRMDGFGVLGSIQKMGIPLVPTMVLTARNQTADVQEAIRLGASDFLAKPFQDHQILARVARLVRASQTKSDLDGPIII